MSLTSSMYVALSGMSMAQAGMEVANHNIANVNTPGYSRQRLNLATSPTWQTGVWGQMGTGVTAENITRNHDQFLTRSIIDKSAEFGSTSSQKAVGSAIEGFFNESDGKGINQGMSDFFRLWDSVADAAELAPTREDLIGISKTLASQLTQRRDDLDTVRKDLNQQVVKAVEDINNIAGSIANINRDIAGLEDHAHNQEANDLRDTRDALMIQLSELVDFNHWEDPVNGAVNIAFSDGPPLILNSKLYEVGVATDESGDVDIIANHRQTKPPWPENVTSKISGGTVGGWINYRENEMRDFYMQYESFVDSFLFQVNSQHSQGVGLEMFTNTVSTSEISNHPSTNMKFQGDNNDLNISALVPHFSQQEPYIAQADPENIAVRFVKSEVPTNEITSQVVWNNGPDKGKWEVTITLPTDSGGNVTATSEDVIRHVNSEKTTGADRGSSPGLPPQGVVWPYKVGDFINIQASKGNNWGGTINFQGSSMPAGGDQFQSLDRSLANMATQGQQLSYGTEQAKISTSLTHTDNDLIFSAISPGDAGERVAIEYLKGDASPSELDLSVYTNIDGTQRISISLATDAKGNILSTAADVLKLTNEHPASRDLVWAEHPTDENGIPQMGLGKVTEMDATYLDRSGYFELVTYDKNGEPTINRVTVDPTDTLEDIAQRVGTTVDGGIKGVRAEIVTNQNGMDNLRLVADTESGYKYGFRDDTSGVLAVLGINNIFTGDSSSDIGINKNLLANSNLLAAGRITVDGEVAVGDNENSLKMSNLKNKRVAFAGQLPEGTLGTGFSTFYSNIGSSNRHITTKNEFSHGTLTEMNNQQDAIAGVNMDEELADIMKYQYMYQASAKIISTIDEMMDSLMAVR